MEKQTFINEMNCHFNLREPKSQRPTNIYCIICIDGKQMKFPTGVKIYPEQWNPKKQEAFISFRLTELDNRNNHIVNDKISQIKQDFLNFKQYLCENPSELVSKIPLLKQYMYKNNMRKKKVILSAIETMRNLVYNSNTAESTKNQHTFNLNKFERFLKANNIEDRFENMNLKTITRYQKHLLDTGSTPKTIKNIIKGTIFPLLQKASKNNDIPFCWNNSNLDSFELVKDSSNKELAMNKKVALTEEQLQSIYNFEINEKSLQPLFKKKTSVNHKSKKLSNAILTSSQYQNYRRIDLMVIHYSATRATQRYTVDLPTSAITTTSPATAWFMPVARFTRWVPTPRATMPTASASTTKVDSTSEAGLAIPAHRNRRKLYASYWNA